MADQQNDQAAGSVAPARNTKASKPIRFIGTFSHGLDAKGRVVIPQTLREKLGEEFYVAPSYDFSSIAVYPTELWEKRCETYEERGDLDPDLNRYKEQFYANSYGGQTCDGQGRLLLPADLRGKILGDERDVRITGAGEYIRVVAAQSSDDDWKNLHRDMQSMLAKIAALEKAKKTEGSDTP